MKYGKIEKLSDLTEKEFAYFVRKVSRRASKDQRKLVAEYDKLKSKNK